MSRLHVFKDSLAISHSYADWDIWPKVYQAKWGDDIQSIEDFRHDGYHQRQGVDRVVTLKSTKRFFIDEKTRTTSYPDIFLETVSHTGRGDPGWVRKWLQADYIHYLIAPLGLSYMLPVPELQAAFREHGARWKLEFKEREVRNPGYSTLGIPVPVPDLFGAIGKFLRFAFDPFDDKVGPNPDGVVLVGMASQVAREPTVPRTPWPPEEPIAAVKREQPLLPGVRLR